MAKRGRRGTQASPVVMQLQRTRDGVSRTSQRLGNDAVQRLRDVEEALPIDAADIGVRMRRGGWRAVRVMGAGLAALPTTTFSAAKAVARAADGAAERTENAGERAREFADDLPSSRRHRRRVAARTLGWSAAAFGAGMVVGWLIAKREVTDPVEEARRFFEDSDPASAPTSESTSGTSATTTEMASDIGGVEATNGARPAQVEREARE